MSQKARIKLQHINEQIAKLEHEKSEQIKKLEAKKAELKVSLKQSIFECVDENILLSDHFDALIGGILDLQKTVLLSSEASSVQINQWKKEGALFLTKGKSNAKGKKRSITNDQSEKHA